MNSILQLKGQFEQQSGNPGGGKRNLPVGRYVEAKHVVELINDLKSLQVYWKKQRCSNQCLLYKRGSQKQQNQSSFVQGGFRPQ